MTRAFLLTPLFAMAAVPASAQTTPPPGEPASPAWSRTALVGLASGSATSPALTFNPAGRALLTWHSFFGPTGAQSHGSIATWDPGSEPVEQPPFSDSQMGAPLVRDEKAVLYARQRFVSRDTKTYTEKWRLGVSAGGFDGSRGRLTTLATFSPAGAVALAQAPNGEEAIAWVENGPPPAGGFANTFRLRMAIRPRGGSFGRAFVAANMGFDEHPGVTDVDVVYTGRNTLTVVYPVVRQPRRRYVREVEALTGRPGHFARQILGPQKGIAEVAVGTSAKGRVVVGWGTQDGGEEADTPYVVRAAIREAGGRHFHTARVLDPGEGLNRPAGRLSLAVAPDGSAALAWSNLTRHPAGYPVRVARSAPGHAFGAPVTLDLTGAAGDVAIGPRGETLVTWSRILRGNEQEPDQVYAALAPAGGVFATPEAVSASNVATSPDAAFDPRSGRPAIVWTERRSGTLPEEGSFSTALRAALRTG